MLKERIKHNDITQLDIVYTDDTHINILVPWEDGNSEYDNKYQETNTGVTLQNEITKSLNNFTCFATLRKN